MAETTSPVLDGYPRAAKGRRMYIEFFGVDGETVVIHNHTDPDKAHVEYDFVVAGGGRPEGSCKVTFWDSGRVTKQHAYPVVPKTPKSKAEPETEKAEAEPKVVAKKK